MLGLLFGFFAPEIAINMSREIKGCLIFRENITGNIRITHR